VNNVMIKRKLESSWLADIYELFKQGPIPRSCTYFTSKFTQIYYTTRKSHA